MGGKDFGGRKVLDEASIANVSDTNNTGINGSLVLLDASSLDLGTPRVSDGTGGLLQGKIPLVCGGQDFKAEKLREQCFVPGLKKTPVKLILSASHASRYSHYVNYIYLD